MSAHVRRRIGRLAVVGGAVLFRPGTAAHKAVGRSLHILTRRMRYLGGRLQGATYRLLGRRPDPDVADDVLADRIRSSLGPLERRLDLPRIHVMVEDHVALLHGETTTDADVDQLMAAVGGVSGVVGVESYLHVGLISGDTRPSSGKLVHQPSDAHRRLFHAATAAGVDPAAAQPSSAPSSPPSPTGSPTLSASRWRPTFRRTSGPYSVHLGVHAAPRPGPRPSWWSGA